MAANQQLWLHAHAYSTIWSYIYMPVQPITQLKNRNLINICMCSYSIIIINRSTINVPWEKFCIFSRIMWQSKNFYTSYKCKHCEQYYCEYNTETFRQYTNAYTVHKIFPSQNIPHSRYATTFPSIVWYTPKSCTIELSSATYLAILGISATIRKPTK